MERRNLSVTLLSLFFVLLLTVPALAIKTARESKLNGGWQIWISAADFDKNEVVQPGVKEKKLADKTPKPWLGKDILIAKVRDGFAEYEFESSVAGKAYIYARVMTLRADGEQSWFIALNSDEPLDSVEIDTAKNQDKPAWAWCTRGFWRKPGGLIGAESPTALKKGKNIVRVRPREADPTKEIMMDIFVISTNRFAPIKGQVGPLFELDANYDAAKEISFAVEAKNRLAPTWAAIKRNF
jgi:hypothetical protein